MKRILIDGRSCRDKQTLHQQLKDQLVFPDYYGKNLDALYDMLSTTQEEVEIGFLNKDELHGNLGSYADALLATLQEAAANNPFLHLSDGTTPAEKVGSQAESENQSEHEL